VWTIVDFIAARALQTIWISRKQAEANVHSNTAAKQTTVRTGRRWLRGDWNDHVMSLYVPLETS
jgi:hypothetical protein